MSRKQLLATAELAELLVNRCALRAFFFRRCHYLLDALYLLSDAKLVKADALHKRFLDYIRAYYALCSEDGVMEEKQRAVVIHFRFTLFVRNSRMGMGRQRAAIYNPFPDPSAFTLRGCPKTALHLALHRALADLLGGKKFV